MTNQKDPKCCCWPYFKFNARSSTDTENSVELLLIAECVPTVYTKNFYQDFIQGKNSDLICPKMDDKSQCVQKLANLIQTTLLDRIIIVRMEQNCCGCLLDLVQDALKAIKKTIPVTEKIVNQKGKVAEIKKKF